MQLLKSKKKYPNDEIAFANGGDRNSKNIPEMSVDGVKFLFSVGGDDKKISALDIKNWQIAQLKILFGAHFIIFLKKII